LQPREAEEEQRRGEAADQRDGELDLDEARREVAVEEARQPRPHAERGQVQTYDQRELRHGIADDVARDGAGQQLVHEPARGDDEDVEKKDRGSVHYPWMVDAMMMANPRSTAPITIASAVFWSSSIS